MAHPARFARALFALRKGRYWLQNDCEDREGDDYAGGEDAHFADFAGEGAGVDFRAGALGSTSSDRVLSGYCGRGCG